MDGEETRKARMEEGKGSRGPNDDAEIRGSLGRIGRLKKDKPKVQCRNPQGRGEKEEGGVLAGLTRHKSSAKIKQESLLRITCR